MYKTVGKKRDRYVQFMINSESLIRSFIPLSDPLTKQKYIHMTQKQRKL